LTAPEVPWLDDMARVAGHVAHVAPSIARKIGAKLATPARGDVAVSRRVSGLNYDRTPLQLCATSSRFGSAARVLADPASGEPDLGRRYERSVAAMNAGLAEQAPDLKGLCHEALRAHAPQSAAADHPDGAMWLAAGLGRPGFAVYVDARHGGRGDARERVERWLLERCPDTADIRGLMAALEGARLQSVGVEGTAPSNARAKVYWRLPAPRRLADLGIERFTDQRFTKFLKAVMDGHSIALDGVVLSAGVALVSGSLSDVKLDVCACPRCLRYTPEGWSDVLTRVTDEHELVALPVTEVLQRAEMAFVGFGTGADNTPRLNLYVKAPGGVSTGASA
jgi:hypothetical protein